MALTVTKQREFRLSNRKLISGLVHFDAAYATGGLVVSPGLFGLKDIEEVVVCTPVSSNLAQVSYDRNSNKLLVYLQDGVSGIVAQAANASDQSAVVNVAVLVIGF